MITHKPIQYSLNISMVSNVLTVPLMIDLKYIITWII